MIWALGLFCLLALVACGGAEFKALQNTKKAEAAYPPIGKFLNVNGTQVHYTDHGDGPAIILLHGAGGNLRDWDFALAPELAKTHRVISFDRPGHGYTSTLANKGATLKEQADLFHAAARMLNVENPMVLGYSFGGAVALRWALDAPEYVRSLVLVSAVSNPWKGPVDLQYRVLASNLFGRLSANAIGGLAKKERIYQGYRGVFAPQPAPEDFIKHVGPELTVRPKSYRENARQVAGMKPQIAEQSQRYGALDLPIEIIHGDADKSVPFHIHAAVLDQKAPNTRLTRLEGMGHGAHVLAQDEIEAAVKRLSK